ncbi:hypothetical protein [Vulcanisaeta sp. JCM 16161]|uniref:hypothetical protein n=1 Tax=Vulcanisaeta sp. JCM 16161 TaxID=1295372 RepID=UPI001FB3E1EF|nr:hypothetical protein [Vulcanisaeta sp. JCM 16161]
MFVLYEFENGNLNFQSFINEINKSLINCGYDPIKVLVSDVMTSFFGAYAVYIPRKPIPIMYVSTELIGKPRPFLGRVLMHEVFHHVLYQRPPSLLFKLAPRRIEPLILITMPLILVIALTIPFNNTIHNFLPYIVIVLSVVTTSIMAILIKALNEHELIATALVIHVITGEWVRDWTYYHNEDALMSIKWRRQVMPEEATAV